MYGHSCNSTQQARHTPKYNIILLSWLSPVLRAIQAYAHTLVAPTVFHG